MSMKEYEKALVDAEVIFLIRLDIRSPCRPLRSVLLAVVFRTYVLRAMVG